VSERIFQRNKIEKNDFLFIIYTFKKLKNNNRYYEESQIGVIQL
jgi:hypothetical protein